MWMQPYAMDFDPVKLQNQAAFTHLHQYLSNTTSLTNHFHLTSSSSSMEPSPRVKPTLPFRLQDNPHSQQNELEDLDADIDFNDLQIGDEDFLQGEIKREDFETNQFQQEGKYDQGNGSAQDQLYCSSEDRGYASNVAMQAEDYQFRQIKEVQIIQGYQNSSPFVSSNQNGRKQRTSLSHRRCINRKIRTTITREKLKAINQIFAEYSKQKEEGKNPKLNLKQIGKQLCLGYSTILHKYREFRSSKVVKGGALIASLQKKRKYKKSLQIEKIIEQALAQRPFYTAVQLASFIHKKHCKKFSRSIISRHLGEMGYSYKNIANNPLEKNKPKYKEIRRIYAVLMMPIVLSTTTILYIDELACSLSNFMKRRAGFRVNEGRYSQCESDYISVIVGVSVDGVLYFQVKMGFINREEFCRTIVRSFQRLRIADRCNPNIEPLDRPFVITDMNKIHRDPEGGQRPIAATLSRFNANRYFLPPISYQLSPLDSIFMNLKHRLWKRDIHHIEELKDLMIRNMNEIMREPTDVYFRDVLLNLEKSKMNENL